MKHAGARGTVPRGRRRVSCDRFAGRRAQRDDRGPPPRCARRLAKRVSDF